VKPSTNTSWQAVQRTCADRSLASRLLCLDDLLHDLGLLDKEGAHDARLDAVTASRAAVRALDSLLTLGDRRVLSRAQRRDAGQRDTAVTALGGGGELFEVVVDELATRGLDHTTAVRLCVVRGALAERHALGHLEKLEETPEYLSYTQLPHMTMSFLTEFAARRVAAFQLPRTIATSAPRAAFSSSVVFQKSAAATVKDTAKTVDRAVSDKLVDGIEIGSTVAAKVKEAGQEVFQGKATGKAAELRGEAQGKASELAGKAKGAAAEAEGKAKSKLS